MESSTKKMGQYMKGNGKMICNMVMGKSYLLMVLSFKGSLDMGRKKGKGCFNGLIRQVMKEISRMIK